MAIASAGYRYSAAILPGTLRGTSAVFRTGAAHALQRGAIIKPLAALHIDLHHSFENGPSRGAPSVSNQISAIRRLLANASPEGSQTSQLFNMVVQVNGSADSGWQE